MIRFAAALAVLTLALSAVPALASVDQAGCAVVIRHDGASLVDIIGPGPDDDVGTFAMDDNNELVLDEEFYLLPAGSYVALYDDGTSEAFDVADCGSNQVAPTPTVDAPTAEPIGDTAQIEALAMAPVPTKPAPRMTLPPTDTAPAIPPPDTDWATALFYFALLAGALLFMVAMAVIAQLIFGPDEDLERPWFPDDRWP